MENLTNRKTEGETSARLLCVLAHPDDETLGFGGTLAKYAMEGVETYVITATRGEKGWFGAPDQYPAPDELGRIREGELRRATAILGVRELILLDYIDGELERADPDEAIATIARHIRRIRPDVVLTFAHDGFYGHPDHIAISQLTTAAIVAAADGTRGIAGRPHATARLYQRAPSFAYMSMYEDAFGELTMKVEGVQRQSSGWADWLITTRIDARPYWRQVWAAVQQHRSQLPSYERLLGQPEEFHEALWGTQEFYRASGLALGPGPERDLFEAALDLSSHRAPLLQRDATPARNAGA